MTSHPVSAAVAVETLKIQEERDILAEVRKVGPYLQKNAVYVCPPLIITKVEIDDPAGTLSAALDDGYVEAARRGVAGGVTK
jgi:adenosylmethionine-8-amino-7-oxononanoate aminotransferase